MLLFIIEIFFFFYFLLELNNLYKLCIISLSVNKLRLQPEKYEGEAIHW